MAVVTVVGVLIAVGVVGRAVMEQAVALATHLVASLGTPLVNPLVVQVEDRQAEVEGRREGVPDPREAAYEPLRKMTSSLS